MLPPVGENKRYIARGCKGISNGGRFKPVLNTVIHEELAWRFWWWHQFWRCWRLLISGRHTVTQFSNVTWGFTAGGVLVFDGSKHAETKCITLMMVIRSIKNPGDNERCGWTDTTKDKSDSSLFVSYSWVDLTTVDCVCREAVKTIASGEHRPHAQDEDGVNGGCVTHVLP